VAPGGPPAGKGFDHRQQRTVAGLN
jgi:hypothetical protein